MLEELKNIILAGIGAAAYSFEKSQAFVEDMVKKGKLTVEEGKTISEELKRTLKKEEKTEANEELKKEKPLTKEDIASLFSEMDFVTKKDLDDLNKRIEDLEGKIK